jgi:hypothetical protein
MSLTLNTDGSGDDQVTKFYEEEKLILKGCMAFMNSKWSEQSWARY